MSQTPQLKKFRWLKHISFIITILSFILLLWIYRPNSYHFWPEYYQAASQPEFRVKAPPPQPFGPVQNDPQEKNVLFVAVNRTKTFLIAAYQEHRTGKKEVRVVSVVRRSETVAYRCLLRCQEQLHITEGVRNIHADHFDFAYGTADIMCPLPSGCEVPSHIALTSDAVDLKELPDSAFLEVKNQEAKRDSFPYDFTVCLSTMFDFTNVLQLVQSLEMLQLLGVNRVVIYKTSSSREIQNILDYYTHKGLVQVIPWSMSGFLNVSHGWQPEYGPGDLHYYGQIPALNDCLYRYMYKSRYVALHDVDELILPQSVNSWSELLPLLEKKYGTDKSYLFENNVFPSTLPPQNDCCPGWQNVPGVNILAHLRHIPPKSYTNYKIIVNPRAVFTVTVHGVLQPQNSHSWVDRGIARMYHTRASIVDQETQNKLIYDDRLLNYSPKLIRAVNTVLTKTGLLPEDSKQ